MLRITALAGLVALGSAKTYVFNAEKCNTNFNNAANWEQFPKGGKSANPIMPAEGEEKEGTFPQTVQFADASGLGVPVDAFLPTGGYKTRVIKFQRNMKLTFATDGAVLNFDQSLTNKETVNFASGQNSGQAECSLGCHSNFFLTTDKAVPALDSAKDLQEASGPDGIPAGSSLSATTNFDVPCGSDTIVLPSGYGYTFLALGFHAYKSVVYKAGDSDTSKVVEASSAAELPGFMTFPSQQQKIFVGKTVIDSCEAYGHTAKIGSKKQCVCTTECPKNGPDGKGKEDDAITQAAVLRAASKTHAQQHLKDLKSVKGKGGDFEYTFANAYGGKPLLECKVDVNAVAKQVNEYYNGAVSTNAPTVTFLAGNRIQVSGALKDTAPEWENSFQLKYDRDLLAHTSIEAFAYKGCDAAQVDDLKKQVIDECKPLFDGALDAASGKNFGGMDTCGCLGPTGTTTGLDAFRRVDESLDCRVQDGAHAVNEVAAACSAKGKTTKATTDVRSDSAASFAMKVYAAVITAASAKGCIKANKAKEYIAHAGVKQTGGATGGAQTVEVFGGSNLPQMDVYRFVDANNKAAVVAHLVEGFAELKTGFDKTATNQIAANFVITSPGERVAGKAAQTTAESHVEARYGYATQLARVQLGVDGWVTASGPQMAPLEAMVNGLLGTLSYDAESGVIKSHHRCFAFDTGYDQACIDAIVQDAISTELEKTECGFGEYDTCEEAARDIAYAAIIDIKQCGILGYATDEKGVRRCYDVQADKEVKDMAKTLSGAVAGQQVASLMTAHSSSMHAYSSSKEAVKSSLRVAWLDHKEERDAKAVTDLDALVKAINAANERAAAKFESLGTNNVPPAPKPAKDDSGSKDAPIRGWDYKALQHTNKLSTDNDNNQAKLQNKQGKYTACNASRFNTSSFVLEEIDYCSKEWDALEAARGDAYVSQHELATYLSAYVQAVGLEAIANGITKEKKAEFEGLNDRLKKVVGDTSNITAYLQSEMDRHSLDSDIAGCEEGSNDENCKLMASLLEKLAALQKSNKETIAAQEATVADGKVAASKAGAPPEDDNMMMIIIIAAAVLVICCLVFVAMMVLMGGGAGAAKGDDQRNVVAFENPMYDDPNQQYGAQPGYDQGYQQENPVFNEATPQDAGDGLYDEPEIATGAAGGGYLDVEPDDDEDDDEDDEDDEDESDDAEDEAEAENAEGGEAEDEAENAEGGEAEAAASGGDDDDEEEEEDDEDEDDEDDDSDDDE